MCCLQAWQLHPGRLLMVGDSFEDVEVGNAAGTASCLITGVALPQTQMHSMQWQRQGSAGSLCSILLVLHDFWHDLHVPGASTLDAGAQGSCCISWLAAGD